MNGRRIQEYRLYEAIQRQPAELARLLTASEPVDLAADALGAARRVFCIGIGSSWHAACVAADLLSRAGIDARAWSSADFVQYPPAFTRDDAAIVFTHTGTKQYSRTAVEMLGKKRSAVILVTSTESEIEAGSLPIGTTVLRTVAREQSAMFTVSHTAAMLLMARVADTVSPACAGSLEAVPYAVEAALGLEGDVESLAHQWQDKRMLIALGAGPHEPSAHEAAIKIAEAARRPVRGYAVEQFLHGPQVQVRDDDAVLAFAGTGAGLGRTREAVTFVRTLGCEVAWVSPETVPDGVLHLRIPDVGEALAPIVEIVPAQLLAGHLAAIEGVDGDNFRRDDPAFGAARAAIRL